MPGLDDQILRSLDVELSARRAQLDIRSDFILAPHYDLVFANARDALVEECVSQLRSGRYRPGLPHTISVPKGKGFTRPGTILDPVDRLVYQLLADACASTLEAELDRNVVFSQMLSDPRQSESLFESTGDAWQRMQAAIRRMGEHGGFILRADVANYFERLPQHHLVNLIRACDVSGSIVNLLEECLLEFRQRESYGIVQGLFSSDVFGNFFLSELDSFCHLNRYRAARYVDDFFIRFDTYPEAQRGLVAIQQHLRSEGLNLNESKTSILPADDLVRDETLIDRLFDAAKDQIQDEWFDQNQGYGFSVDWIEEVDIEDQVDVEVSAVLRLFEARVEYPQHVDRIDRFCLPVLRAVWNDSAVDVVIASFLDKPHLSKLYLSYLSRFAPLNANITDHLSEFLESEHVYTDYQRMFLLATFMNSDAVPRRVVSYALRRLTDRSSGAELRALAGMLAAKFGTANQRRAVRLAFEQEPSPYVRSAILYSSKYFGSAERRTCRLAWGHLSLENRLVVQAISESS